MSELSILPSITYPILLFSHDTIAFCEYPLTFRIGEIMIELRIYLDNALIQRTTLSKNRITLGRSEDNDVVLTNPHVSRLQAVIQHEGDSVILIDKSKNGILLDSQRISESTTLPSKCRLNIYPFEIEYLSYMEDATAPIPKPGEQLSTSLASSQIQSKQQFATAVHFSGLVGESPTMQQIYQLIQDVGDTPATVLIQGEHGTGKELVARALHDVSQRHNKTFVPVNCAAIPLDLIESELFGYEKGAFTGAQTGKCGKIEEANDGTLFLDEIGELSMSAQAKLLRFLQQKAIQKLGSAKEAPVNVRVVAATNRELEKAAEEGDFRADLYYRLRVVQIMLPPLRQHQEDIPLLVSHFTKKITSELGQPHEPSYTDDAMHLLKTSSWPGNIRQLENSLYSAILRSRSSRTIDKDVLLQDTSNWGAERINEDSAPLDNVNKQALLQVLIQQQWDTTKAAEILKVSRGTIYYKMKKYGIDPSRPSSRGSR